MQNKAKLNHTILPIIEPTSNKKRLHEIRGGCWPTPAVGQRGREVKAGPRGGVCEGQLLLQGDAGQIGLEVHAEVPQVPRDAEREVELPCCRRPRGRLECPRGETSAKELHTTFMFLQFCTF